MHKCPLKPECPPVKQKLRRTRPDMALKIRDEVRKQFDAGFLAVAKYPEWIANIVPVPKKDGKVRMCVDYRDLNKASPKDDFPLPRIDVLVDNTAQFSVFSFMDGFSGYNQIKMDPADMEKTTFITPWDSAQGKQRRHQKEEPDRSTPLGKQKQENRKENLIAQSKRSCWGESNTRKETKSRIGT